MNTKKKIIYTLRSADKDSVEKLMADAAKKEEIFARIKERTEKDSEYTDVAEGVEKYSRRMKISHTASAAAASLLLIAGTYTPYCLITLQDNHGILLAALVWGFALLGIGIEAFWTYRPRWISAVIYVVLGWLVAFFMPAVVNNLASAGFALLLAGGICYTIGAIFYVLKKIPYMHSVFHLFVLAGTILQFLSIELYVL